MVPQKNKLITTTTKKQRNWVWNCVSTILIIHVWACRHSLSVSDFRKLIVEGLIIIALYTVLISQIFFKAYTEFQKT